MRSEEQLAELGREFPELLGPTTLWMKEVLSHFGLLFSTYAILEAGLQNIYIYYSLIKIGRAGTITSRGKWASLSQEFEARAFKLTMGGLLKELDGCDELSELRPELQSLNKKRNYFAHHFFREENHHFNRKDNMIAMIYEFNKVRREIIRVDSGCDRALERMIVGYAPSFWRNIDLDGELTRIKKEGEERARRGPKFGWEGL